MTTIYDRFNSYQSNRDGAVVHHYFAPGAEFWFRREGGRNSEWLVFATVPHPHVDEWRTIEIDEWEAEMGGEVAWDDLMVYLNKVGA
jgi:hypothetical protein